MLIKCLPGNGRLEAKPSNKSIIGAAPAGDEAWMDIEEGDDSLSNVGAGILLSWLEDKISGVDKLLCAGGGVPIDRRSRRTSVPAFGTWVIPEMQERERVRINMHLRLNKLP